MANPRVNQTEPGTFLKVLGDRIDEDHTANRSVGLLVIHIENFDRLVSAFGYRLGDDLISRIAGLVQSRARPLDRVIRIGESKFAVIISPLRDDGILVLAANKIGSICNAPISIGRNDVAVSMRIGAASAGNMNPTAEELLQNAEIAVLNAIANDAEYAVFSPEQHEQATDLLKLEAELEMAIRRGDFEMHYQPKIAARDGSIVGAEALMRWNSPNRGFVSPELFIPMSDQTGRMEPLTQFALNTALRHASEWPDRTSVSVNVSPRMLLTSELVDMVESAIKIWDLPARRLCLEITEGALMTNPAVSFGILTSLRDLGCRISIDDFGTGYSSLSYFKDIPADELKIDKSFVLNMFESDGDQRIVKAVVQLSKAFGLTVTAEGVEDERTASMLRELGCDNLQGFHYSKAVPNGDFLSLVRSKTPVPWLASV